MKRRSKREVWGEKTLAGPYVVPKTHRVTQFDLEILGVQRDERTAKQRRFERRALLRKMKSNG